MSTQDDTGLSFDICNEQQNVRLLELPPSLLELITSRQRLNLELKSAAPGASGASVQAPPSAVLCTDQKTYQVRQVQSSNSVYVLQPSQYRQTSDIDTKDGASISAIAQCGVTLELVPTSPSSTECLKQLLPAYSGSEDIHTSSLPLVTSRNALLEDAPFSSEEFDKAWRDLCVFELDGRAWLPTASALLNVWKSMVSAALVRNVTLGDGFQFDALNGVIEEDGHPKALCRAIIDRLASESQDLIDGFAVLDRDKTVLWVGILFLESQQAFADGVPLSVFIQDWQNHLPENWRKHCRLDSLEGFYTQPSKNKIAYSPGRSEGAKLKDTAQSSKSSRKWHEKFKNARR